MATNDSIGTKGREALKEALTADSSIAVEAIDEFQKKNAILVPSLQSALGLFDLFGMSRYSYCLVTAEALRDKFNDHLNHLPQPIDDETVEKLNDYLSRYCNLAVDVPLLQTVIFNAAMVVPVLSEEVLDKFIARPLFDACPTDLRQKIYEQHPGFFKNAVFRLVASYINSIENSFRTSLSGQSSKLSADVVNLFRKHDSIQSLTSLVGHSTQLYSSVLTLLDEIFEETENDIICSMKTSVILALAGLSETLRQAEPFYQLCWCIDTCVRNQTFEIKQLKQLQSVCESVKDIGSLAIILADPIFVDLACKKLISFSAESINSETLLRHSQYAQFLVYLLKLGHHNLLVKKNFKGFLDMVDLAVYFDFLAALSTTVVDANIAASGEDMGDDDLAEKPAEAFISKTAEGDILCWLLLLHHCQVHPTAITTDILVTCLPEDGLTDSVLFELVWVLSPMLQQRPSFFLDTISAFLSKISSANTSSEIICSYTMRLFDLGLSFLENALVHQLPAIIECIKTTVTSISEISDQDREKLITFFENAAAKFDV